MWYPVDEWIALGMSTPCWLPLTGTCPPVRACGRSDVARHARVPWHRSARRPRRARAPPPIKHVFVIVLENKDFDETFGRGLPGAVPAKTLTAQGQLLRQYYGTSHAEPRQLHRHDQRPGAEPGHPVRLPAATWTSSRASMGADGQALGAGCVYPSRGQDGRRPARRAKGLTLARLHGGHGRRPGARRATCRHPAIGGQDKTQTRRGERPVRDAPQPVRVLPLDHRRPGAAATRTSSTCASSGPTWRRRGTTPEPRVHHARPVLRRPRRPVRRRPARAACAASTRSCKTWVPRILASPAVRAGRAARHHLRRGREPRPDASAPAATSRPGPNTPSPGVVAARAAGGPARSSLSPYVAPGSVNDTPYNHYALLRSIEDLFGLGHLGYAGVASLKPFGADVFGAAGTVDLSGPGSSERAVHAAPAGRQASACAAGALISALKIERRSASQVALRVTTSRRARLYAHVPGRRHALRARGKRCGSVLFSLPRSHGRVRLAASVRQGTERRTIVY